MGSFAARAAWRTAGRIEEAAGAGNVDGARSALPGLSAEVDRLLTALSGEAAPAEPG